MSEGPEVKITADQLSNALSSKRIIQDILCNKIDEEFKRKIIGSYMEYVKTFGKNIVIKFSSDVYLRNHMMLWGRWRIYERDEYDRGLAKSPPRSAYKKSKYKNVENIQGEIYKMDDVRQDARVRLIISTQDKILVQFNGPIIQFSIDNPQYREPIRSLGPDGLSNNYEEDKIHTLLKSKTINTDILISNALLDQQIVCGIGNKYKSEILFVNKIYPFKKVTSLSETELNRVILSIPKILNYGYRNKGRTRMPSMKEKTTWDTTHHVFRRSGKPCWDCGTKIVSERKMTFRQTFWCPHCQPA